MDMSMKTIPVKPGWERLPMHCMPGPALFIPGAVSWASCKPIENCGFNQMLYNV